MHSFTIDVIDKYVKKTIHSVTLISQIQTQRPHIAVPFPAVANTVSILSTCFHATFHSLSSIISFLQILHMGINRFAVLSMSRDGVLAEFFFVSVLYKKFFFSTSTLVDALSSV